MNEAWVWAWLAAFVVTQVVETPLYTLALSQRDARACSWLDSFGARLAVAFMASCLTHPVVWFVIPLFVDYRTDYMLYFGTAEGFAVIAETAWLYLFLRPTAVLAPTLEEKSVPPVSADTGATQPKPVRALETAFAWSLLTNGTSVLVGFTLQRLQRLGVI